MIIESIFSISLSGWNDKSFITKDRIEMSESWLKIILFTFQLELNNWIIELNRTASVCVSLLPEYLYTNNEFILFCQYQRLNEDMCRIKAVCWGTKLRFLLHLNWGNGVQFNVYTYSIQFVSFALNWKININKKGSRISSFFLLSICLSFRLLFHFSLNRIQMPNNNIYSAEMLKRTRSKIGSTNNFYFWFWLLIYRNDSFSSVSPILRRSCKYVRILYKANVQFLSDIFFIPFSIQFNWIHCVISVLMVYFHSFTQLDQILFLLPFYVLLSWRKLKGAFLLDSSANVYLKISINYPSTQNITEWGVGDCGWERRRSG